MLINGLTNIREIYATKQSVIYDACSEKGDIPVFILKKNIIRNTLESRQNKEKEITQTINYYAPRSVVIPVMDKVYDEQGNEYLRMENKKTGQFLSEFVRKKNLSLDFALNCGEEILKSLEVLHSFAGSENRIGYLHLDIHPGNIFMENADVDARIPGTAKFLDFAASVRVVNGVPENRNGVYVSAYSAPELYYENATVAPTTDLYSVAAVIYTLFTGFMPPGSEEQNNGKSGLFFTEENEDAARAAGIIAYHKCKDEGLADCIGKEVEALFNCCMCLNPVYRPQKAHEMLELIHWVRRLIKSCEENSYEEIFRAEYEHSKSVEEVCAGTLNFDQRKFAEAVKSLGNQLLCDNIDVPFTKYLFELYWEMAKKNWDKLDGEALYDLIGSGIAVSNHTADVFLGSELQEQLERLKQKMDLRQYLFLLNRIAVQKADLYRFKEAYELQARNIEAQRILQQGAWKAGELLSMNSEENLRNAELAKALSSAAGYKAMAYPETEPQEIYSLYQEALQGFSKEADRKITMSHMMHYAMLIRDKRMFEKVASDYYGYPLNGTRESLICILNVLVRDCIDQYGFYAFVKAMYLFYLDQCIQDDFIMHKLYEAGEILLPKGKAYDPLQAIFKYLALVEYKKCGIINERVEEYYLTSLRWGDYDGIETNQPLNIYILKAYQTEAIFAELKGDNHLISELTLQLKEQAKRDKWDYLVKELDNGRALKDILSFEYA